MQVQSFLGLIRRKFEEIKFKWRSSDGDNSIRRTLRTRLERWDASSWDGPCPSSSGKYEINLKWWRRGQDKLFKVILQCPGSVTQSSTKIVFGCYNVIFPISAFSCSQLFKSRVTNGVLNAIFPFWAQMKIVIIASCDDLCENFLTRN